MSLRHAAALALVAFYLMVPPRKYRDGHELVGLERETALNRWMIQKSFDSRSACETDRQSQLKSRLLWYRQHLDICPPGIGSSVATEQLVSCSMLLEALAAQCVASDDSRLEKK